MTSPHLTANQLAALQAAVSIAFEGKPKPKGSQAEYIHGQAKAALEALKAGAAR